ncbi:MAG: hypothetical protein AAGC81_09760 [Pseudomonadota bacterium]
MTDKDTQTDTAELKEDDLDKAQGGFVIANDGGLGAKQKIRRSRGNNVFGFEDLPNN